MQEQAEYLNDNSEEDSNEREIMGEDRWGQDEETQWSTDSVEDIRRFTEQDMNSFN